MLKVNNGVKIILILEQICKINLNNTYVYITFIYVHALKYVIYNVYFCIFVYVLVFSLRMFIIGLLSCFNDSSYYNILLLKTI